MSCLMLSPDVPAAEYAGDPCASAIVEAERWLTELQDHWLNPPEWVSGRTNQLPAIRSTRPPTTQRQRKCSRIAR